MVHHRYRMAARDTVLLRQKEPALGGPEAQGREVVAGHQLAEHPFGGTGRLQRNNLRRCIARESVKDFVFCLVIFQIGVRDRQDHPRLRRTLRLRSGNGHQLGGVLNGQWIQDECVDDRENSGVCADTQSQRQDHKKNEERIFPHGAGAVA